MKLTKETLIKIIKEEYDAYSIENIRERGNADEMANEVWQIMSSMGTGPVFTAEDTFGMIHEAIDMEDAGQFWFNMLSPDGHLGDAIRGLRQTKADEYDPDSPYNVPPMEESKREQILKIVKEELAAVLAESGASFGTRQSRRLAKKHGSGHLSPKTLGPLQQLGNQLAAGMENMTDEEKEQVIDMIANLAGLTNLKDADPAGAPVRDPSLEENWGKKSYAWHQDGGANDEGFSHKYCSSCGKRTEHEMGRCIPCIDKRGARTQQARERNQPLLDAIAQAGSNNFLQKMERQLNQGRDLSQRQRIVVMQILRSRGVDTAGLE